jgi:hypothetical protein
LAPNSADPKKRRKIPSWIGTFIFILVMLVAGGWGVLIVLYAPVLPENLRIPAALTIGALMLLSIIGVFLRRLRPAVAVLALAVALATLSWAQVKPSHAGDWPAEVSRLAQASIDGDRVTMTNVRNFEWHGTDQFVERWEVRTYSLSSLKRLDMITSYWAGPNIAHVLLSFGFDTGDHLVASIEIRRRSDQQYSTLKGAFRNFEIIYILGDERDLLRLRTTFRKERVYLFRLRTPPEAVRRLFLEYLLTINDLADHPRFYNTLTTNCTTQVRVAGLAAGAVIPWNWRLLLTGHVPDYLYSRGSVDTRLPLPELFRRSQINEAADRADDSDSFSAAIRETVPDPLR